MRSWVWGNADIPVTQGWMVNGHCGIDIGCRSGTVIYAARAGVVERVQTGMTSVRVGNQRDFYLHGTSLVSVGQAVAQGSPVIRSGAVQVDPRYPLTGPHLHFEVQDGLTLPGAPPSNPGRPLNPVPVLLAAQPYLGGAASGSSSSAEEEEMIFVGPIHKLAVTIRAFVAGSSYSAPINDARLIVGPILKGAALAFDGYRYSSSGVVSSDLSGAAGTQPGSSYVWWHAVTGQWVPDAVLDTSKLAASMPAAAIPATEKMVLYFASAEAQGGDLSNYATHDEVKAGDAAVVAKIPTKVTSQLS